MEKSLEAGLWQMKQLSEVCEGEEALKEYIICMSRLLSGAIQMNYTYFHSYEREILQLPLEVFLKQFVEQVNAALECNDTLEKKLIIKDIENSLFEISNVYKNLIDSTSNSERQIFLNREVNTNMYELSPKICVFYSGILGQIVNMFDSGENSYAFVLHPTFRNNTEACQLFRKRKNSGKIVIIFIPENAIEEFDVLPIHLLHESFHVITKRERLRKLRAKCYLQHMVLGIKQLLFYKVCFGEKDSDLRVKEALMEFWLEDVKKISQRIVNMPDDSRGFYSEELSSVVIKDLGEMLIRIDSQIVEGVERFFCGRHLQSLEEYQENRKMAIRIANLIRKNLFETLCLDKLRLMSEMFFRIYREGYADIACILTLNASSDAYDLTFNRAVQFTVKDQFIDFEKRVRCMLVADAVRKRCSDEKWEHYYRDLSTTVKQKTPQKKNDEITRQDTTGCVIINFNKQMEEIFSEYFCECAKQFEETLKHLEGLEEFRKRIHYVMKSEQREILPIVMSGQGYSFPIR